MKLSIRTPVRHPPYIYTKAAYLFATTCQPQYIFHHQPLYGTIAKLLYWLVLQLKYIQYSAANRVYNTMIQPIFDYADTSWGVLSEACNNELQRLQNRAARIVLRRNRTENCLSSLNWLHLSTRRKIHRCVLVFKISNNCVPVYFNNYFTKTQTFIVLIQDTKITLYYLK